MSAISILTLGPQARSGASEAVDVSGFSTLRLDLQAHADMGVSPFVTIYIETSSTGTGSWIVMQKKQFFASRVPPDDLAWPSGRTRIVLSGFDRYLRVRWEAGRSGEPLSAYSAGNPNAPVAAELTDIGLVLGLTGDGQPDAE